MACCMFSAIPLLESMMAYCLIGFLGTYFSEVCIKTQQFPKLLWICQNDSHLVLSQCVNSSTLDPTFANQDFHTSFWQSTPFNYIDIIKNITVVINMTCMMSHQHTIIKHGWFFNYMDIVQMWYTKSMIKQSLHHHQAWMIWYQRKKFAKLHGNQPCVGDMICPRLNMKCAIKSCKILAIIWQISSIYRICKST